MKPLRSAKAIILDKENNVLVLRRSNTHPRNPLKADLPGGLIEEGEEVRTGLAREVLEETGLAISSVSFRMLHEYTQHRLEPDVFIHRFLYVTRVDVVEPAIELSYEHSSYSWELLSVLPKQDISKNQKIEEAIAGDAELTRISERDPSSGHAQG